MMIAGDNSKQKPENDSPAARIEFQKFMIALFCMIAMATLVPDCLQAQVNESREWSDSTGKFKVTAKLVEVKDGVAILKSKDGKVLKIPTSRLSNADKEFLKGADNPFTEMGSDENDDSSTPKSSDKGGGGSTGWESELIIDWNEVKELDRSTDSDWKLELPKKNGLGFAPKKANLNKLNRAHEDIRCLIVDPLAQRAVAGYTVGFTLPKPESRLALVDLVSGKTVHTAPVIGDMCPIAILNDGSTVVMNGTGDERSGYETRDQLQLWRVDGKNVIQSRSWVPFPGEEERFGRKENGILAAVIALPNNRLVLLSNQGRLVCVDALTRKPFWQTRLSRENAVCASIDRTLLGVADSQTILIIDPKAGVVKASSSLEDKPATGWPRVRWSPSGKKLLYSFMADLRVLDLETGKWVQKCSLPAANVLAPNNVDYPHDDFALVENRTLIHIPSQIKVCEYRDAKQIVTVGDSSFISLHENDRGLIVPAKVPHPAADEILTKAVDNPDVFLIRPGVEVSIDASGAGQWAGEVSEGLKKAAEASGYKVVDNASISIVGSINGPKQEAVSYIAAGSYVANVYHSKIRIVFEGKDVWTTGGSNIPHMIQTERGQSMQEKIDELGKSPSLWVFSNGRFPKILQKPATDQSQGSSDALMISKFTMQGLVDPKR